MKFFNKVEFKPLSWDTHSQTAHSATTIVYLGLNEAGWTKLQLKPRSDNQEGSMATALQSVCIDMVNPDEESDTQPNPYTLINAKDYSSTTVEVENVVVFLDHLVYSRCITANDAESISDALNKHHKQAEQCSTPATFAPTEAKENVDTRSTVDIPSYL